jgi:exopolyphosphatase/guanosine-5'-triphosphate,3'-diphosphate pyrophosphatase
MASNTHPIAPRKIERTGLAHFMTRVLKECSRAARRFEADAVHDLRVALRRSRAIADGLSNVDPDKSLRALKTDSRELFRSLGNLRDIQVMLDWVQKLDPTDDPLKPRIREILSQEQEAAKSDAATALGEFDVRRWRKWSRDLSEKSRRIPAGSHVFEHLALERWIEAREMHRRAIRSRSRIGWHRVRIALKRFRYTLENFLPRHYAEWSEELKSVQDLLGAVHDLDVLRAKLRRIAASSGENAISTWLIWIDTARAEKLAEYRAKTFGKHSLWNIWRAGLLEGERLEAAALSTLVSWASYRDPDIEHSRRVSKLALELYDGFRDAQLNHTFREPRSRRILEAAALLHDVGCAKQDSGHHKASYRMIRKLSPPLGWTSDDLLLTALVARYHRGAEPSAEHEGYSSLMPEEREGVAWLAATIRLADGLDSDHNGRVSHVAVETSRPALIVRAEGYLHDVESASALAKKKHLLETLCNTPVIVQPAREFAAAAVAGLAS